MKKLNKLLLMAAALSGALVPKTGAYLDINIDEVTNTSKNVDENKINDLVKQLEKKYPIEIIREACKVGYENPKIDYQIIKSVEACLRLPAISWAMKELSNTEEQDSDGHNIIRQYKINIKNKNPNSQMLAAENRIVDADTTQKEMNFYRTELTKPLLFTDNLFDLSNIWKVFFLSADMIPMGADWDKWTTSYILSVVAHECGHAISYAKKKELQRTNTGEWYDTNPDDWIEDDFKIQYKRDLNYDSEKLNKILAPTEYSKTNYEEWFAELIAKAILPSSNTGKSPESRILEKSLSTVLNIKNCLTPES